MQAERCTTGIFQDTVDFEVHEMSDVKIVYLTSFHQCCCPCCAQYVTWLWIIYFWVQFPVCSVVWWGWSGSVVPANSSQLCNYWYHGVCPGCWPALLRQNESESLLPSPSLPSAAPASVRGGGECHAAYPQYPGTKLHLLLMLLILHIHWFHAACLSWQYSQLKRIQQHFPIKYRLILIP